MIDKMLNNYKKNIASIEMLKIKINQWQEILTKDIQEIDRIYARPKNENLGISRTGPGNPTESMVIRVEEQKQKINTWIENGYKTIDKLKEETKMIEILLESLDEETAFIIKEKHFEKKKWNIITHQFNSKYRNQYHEYITSAGVRKKYEVAKRELSDLFEKFLPKF